MSLNLSQGQVGDVAHQGLEAFVLAYPLLDFGKQILGDVHGAGFALYFIGQVMSQMPLTGLAVATGPATFSSKGDQAGGDKRALGFELLETGVEVTADQGRVFGNFHIGPGVYQVHGAGMTDTYTYASDMASKIDGAMNLFFRRFQAGRQGVCKPADLAAYGRLPGCEDLGIPQS